MHLNPLPTSVVTLFSLLIGTLSISSVTADTKLTYIDTLGDKKRTTLIQVNDHKVRMEEAGSGIYSLYDDEQKVLYTINTRTKQYIETSPEKVKARMAKMTAFQDKLKAQMKQQIALLPPEQRKIAEARMQQAEAMRKQTPPAMTFTTTDRQATVQNIPCKVSVMSINGQAAREICNASDGVMDKADFERLLAMFKYMDSIAQESAKAQGMTPPSEGSASTHKNGLALLVRAVPQGSRSELQAINKDDLPETAFVLPADYKAFEPADMPMQAPTN